LSAIGAFFMAALLQTSVPIRTVDKGDQSNVDSQRQAVVRTATEWNTLWRQHSPDRPRPSVNLARDMVIGVFLGSQNTAGYAVEIVSVQNEYGGIVVRYSQTSPPQGAITAQVITSPYHLVAVPKAPGEVKFERVSSP
jgi:hypothetical protein